MKTSVRFELPQWLILAGVFIASLIAWSSAADRVPVHWGLNGDVDRYGGKFEGLLLLPLIATGTYVLLLLLPRIDPGEANYARFALAYVVIRMATLLLFATIHALVIAAATGVDVAMDRILPVSMGVLFVVIGLVMGKPRPNWFVGIRTPWTLSSRHSWVRTHRLGGWLFIGIGVVAITSVGFPPSWLPPALVALGIGGAIAMFAYSYLEWRKDPDRTVPGASSH